MSAYLLLLFVAVTLSQNRQKDSHATTNNLQLLEPSTECHSEEQADTGSSSTFDSTCVSGSLVTVESLTGLYQTFTSVILETSNSVLVTRTEYLIGQVITFTTVVGPRRGFAVKEDFWKGLST